VSWYEQKAVAILLTLLHLGIKNIRLGPSLPAFVTPDVLNVLVEKFNIMPSIPGRHGADRGPARRTGGP
jgi:hydroxylamine reductase